MEVDASGLTSSLGVIAFIVCDDASITSAAGSTGVVTCMGSVDSRVSTTFAVDVAVACRPILLSLYLSALYCSTQFQEGQGIGRFVSFCQEFSQSASVVCPVLQLGSLMRIGKHAVTRI